MSRVDIRGQFVVDNIFTAYKRGKVEVDRENASLPYSPSNWNAFCDAVDDALKSVSSTKTCCRVYGIFLCLVLIGFVVIAFFLPGISSELKVVLNPYVKLSYAIPTLVMCIVAWYLSRRRLTRAMYTVQRICEEQSIAGVVTYELMGYNGIRYGSVGHEWTSPCKTEREYYIMVNVGSDAVVYVGNDVEQRQAKVRTKNIKPKPESSINMGRSDGQNEHQLQNSSAEIL